MVVEVLESLSVLNETAFQPDARLDRAVAAPRTSSRPPSRASTPAFPAHQLGQPGRERSTGATRRVEDGVQISRVSTECGSRAQRATARCVTDETVDDIGEPVL